MISLDEMVNATLAFNESGLLPFFNLLLRSSINFSFLDTEDTGTGHIVTG